MDTNEQIFEVLKNAKTIGIIAHINPDGDCLGSALGLGLSLKNMNKKVCFFVDDSIHFNYKFFAKNYFTREDISKDIDCLIAVDCSDLNRLGKYSEAFTKHSNTIVFDHHITNTNFGKINQVEIDVTSACEVVYKFLKQFDITINNEIAQSLYVGLCTDTGCFEHSNVSPFAHEMAGELLKYEFDFESAHYYLFRRKTYNQLKLLTTALNSIQSFYGGKLNIMTLTRSCFLKTNTDEKDVIGFVNYGLYIDGVEICAIISESDNNCYQISFRSKGKLPANEVALKFGGGGHIMASGCKIWGSHNTVKRKIIEALGDYFD